MKKIYLSFIALTFLTMPLSALGGEAGETVTRNETGLPVRAGVSLATSTDVSTRLVTGVNINVGASVRAQNSDLPTTMIVATPAGSLSQMYRTVTGFYADEQGNVHQASADGYYGQVVEGENGEFYMKEAFGFTSFGTWIKGEKTADGNVVFKFPQLVGEFIDPYTGQTEHYYAQAMTQTGNTFTVADDNEVVFTWKDGVLKKTNPKVLLGATNAAGGWAGYGDQEATLSVFTDKSQAPADPAKAAKYIISYKDHEGIKAQGYVYITNENGSFFIENLDKNVKNGWIKGTLNGNKVTFKKQYVGIDTENEAYAYFTPVKIAQGTDESGNTKYDYEFADELTFAYDEAAGKLTADGDFLINQGKNFPAPITVYQGASLSPRTDDVMTPANPEIISFQRAQQSLDNPGYIAFKLPSKTVDGDVLDVKKMYFRMYFDNSLYTFEDFWYIGLEGTPYAGVTDMPATFTDEDVLSEPDFLVEGDTHIVTVFNNAKFKKIGIQSVYKSSGETKTSDITYYDDSEAGIGRINPDDATEKGNVTFYDLGGRRVTVLSPGIYIKSVELTDGSRKTVKTIVK